MRKKLLAAALLSIGLLLLAGWWLGRAPFVQFALERAVIASDGRLSVGQVSGSLFSDLRIDRVGWREPESADGKLGMSIDLQQLRLGWQPFSLLHGELDLLNLSVARVELGLADAEDSADPAKAAPVQLPAALALPIALRLRNLEIGSLQINAGKQAVTAVERISVVAVYRSHELRIDKLAVGSEYGQLNLFARIADRAPYPLIAGLQFDAHGPEALGAGLPVAAVLSGNLDKLLVNIAASLPAVQVDATLKPEQREQRQPGLISAQFALSPFAQQAIGDIDLRLREFNPAALGLASGMSMLLDGHADIRVQLADQSGPMQVQGQVRMANRLAGSLAEQKLALRELQSRFAWRDGRLDLSGISLQMTGDGLVSGNAQLDSRSMQLVGGISIPQLQLDLMIDGVDPGAWTPTLGGARLDGQVKLIDQRLELKLSDRGIKGLALSLDAHLQGQRLLLDRAVLRGLPAMADAQLELVGSLALQAPRELEMQGRFSRIDPSRIAAMLARLKNRFDLLDTMPALDVADQGRASASGWQATLARLPGRLDGQVQLATRLDGDKAAPVRIGPLAISGQLAGAEVSVNGQLKLAAQGFTGAQLELRVDDARLRAHGGLGLPGETLVLSLKAGKLSRLRAILGLPALAGELTLDARLSGALTRPAVELSANGRSLELPGGLRIGSLQMTASTPQLAVVEADSRVQLSVQLRKLSQAGRQAERLTLDLDGTLAAHRFQVELDSKKIGLRTAGQASLTDRWQARFTQLSITGLLQAALREPFELRVTGDGVGVSSVVLANDFARLDLFSGSWSDGRFGLDARLKLDRLGPLMRIGQPEQASGKSQENEALAQLQQFGLGLEMKLEGSGPQDLTGRVQADLIAPASMAVGGSALVQFAAGQMDGDLNLDLPSLAFTERLIGPEWLLDGRLRFNGKLAGTIAQPRLIGDLQGERLRFEQRALGWRLGNGTLAGHFDGNQFEVRLLRFESIAKGGGDLRMSGVVQVESMQGRFDFTANRLVVPIGPGQRVVLSGQASASSTQGRLQIAGKLGVDEGRIELVGGDAPNLPPDVFVRGAQRSAEAVSEKPATGVPLAIETNLQLQLGDKLFVHGSGLDARLAGSLQLKGSLPDAPRGYGTVQVRDGTFAAYGKELEITRGRIVFNGPLDNPILDIVALRREQAVEAGVSVEGTVLAPKIRLTSVPDVPDAEKLSWLVLGQGLDGAGGAAQMAALQAAAATLLGSGDSGGATSLRQSIGLDVLTLRSADSGGGLTPQGFGDPVSFPGQMGRAANTPASSAAANNVIAVGKKLTSKLLLSYEQGLHGTWSLLKIQYALTRRLSLRAQTGSQTALDLLFSYPFD